MLLSNADIIGVTMTGAAKFFMQLNFCKPAIMIVEEAAEALESHLISSLVPTIEQLILIGDHQQLRPIPATHALAKDYNLDVSLFERLFKNQAPSATLVTQHRMRPCIADLLVPSIYAELESAENVKNYEQVLGTNKSVFFFKHDHPESVTPLTSSISNEFEASFIANLAYHFLKQGYKEHQITILAMYNAQILSIRNLVSKMDINVNVTTVDNYQGEENDIILISFVRSNDADSIGFLKESNRICVALSRARKGLYCIGNFSMFSRKSKLFEQLNEKLVMGDSIGTGFPLQCQIHKRIIEVKESDDFQKFFENGCQGTCNYKLPCGHECSKLCHSTDLEHKFYKCREPCQKVICDPSNISPGVICKHLCWQPCEIKKKKIKLPCGHKVSVNYNEEVCVSSYKCQHEIDKLLNCNHLVKVPCSDKFDQIVCKAVVRITLNCGHLKSVPCGYKESREEIHCEEFEYYYSPCGHTVEVPCSEFPDEDSLTSYCKKPCDSLLTCGHACVGFCAACIELGIHSLCSYDCDLTLPCGHPCHGRCGVPCLPCDMVCILRCHHRVCRNPCSKSCVECTEPCMRQCIHQNCTLPCYMPCDVAPCEEQCTKLLDCGHPCIGLCGDPCPFLCRVCNHESLQSDNPDSDFFILLEDCGHIIEVEKLTKFVEESVTAYIWPCCPECGKQIGKTLRFSDQLKEFKLLLVNSYDFVEEKEYVEYRLRTVFGEDNIAPWHFEPIKRKIQYALEHCGQSESLLCTLNMILLSVEKLIYIERNLENNPKVECKLEMLLAWMYQHIENASFQQIHELEKAVCLLEKLFYLP